MKLRKIHLMVFLIFCAVMGVLVLLGMRPGKAQLKFHGYMEVQIHGQPMTAAVLSFRPGVRHAKFLQVNESGTGVIRFKEGTDWSPPTSLFNTVEYDNLNGTRIVLIPAQALDQTWRYDRNHEQFLVLKLPKTRPRVVFKRKVQLTSGEIDAAN
jgi:hypothetical protein